MSDDLVLREQRGAVTVLTLNDAKRRNPWSLRMRELVEQELSELQEDEAVRAIVLTGAGGAFCAGGDMAEWGDWTLGKTRHRLRVSGKVMRMLALGSRPVVAAVEGPAFGAGLSLVSAADYVVAAENAKFSCAFIKMALVPDTGAFWSLPLKVGPGKAWELFSLGEPFGAEEALRMGLVNKVVPAGEALPAAMAVAEKYAALPTQTLSLMKAIRFESSQTLDSAINAEINIQPMAMATADHKEAVAAFREKRPPKFQGK